MSGTTLPELLETLRSYAGEVERKVNIWAPYWKRKKSRIPTLVALTRQHSLYERSLESNTAKQGRLTILVTGTAQK
jgi:hypothetical protein